MHVCIHVCMCMCVYQKVHVFVCVGCLLVHWAHLRPGLVPLVRGDDLMVYLFDPEAKRTQKHG